MEFNNTENKSYETEDGVVWKSRSVTVCAVLMTVDDYILVTKRSDKMPVEPSKWCLPCGFLDWDESIHQGLIREMHEEVGLDITGCQCDLYQIGDKPTTQQNISFHFIVWLMQQKSDVEKLVSYDPNEVKQVVFLHRHQLMDNDHTYEFGFNHGERLHRLANTNIITPYHSCNLIFESESQFNVMREW